MNKESQVQQTLRDICEKRYNNLLSFLYKDEDFIWAEAARINKENPHLNCGLWDTTTIVREKLTEALAIVVKKLKRLLHILRTKLSRYVKINMKEFHCRYIKTRVFYILNH